MAIDTLPPFVSQEIIRFFIVFTRIAGAIMVLPGFGELVVPPRMRLGIAFMTALALTPSVPGLAQAAADSSTMGLVQVLFYELTIGVFIGMGAKLFLAALQVAGGIGALAIGLSNPFSMEVGGFEGGTLLSGTMVITGLAAIFATDLHYLMLDAVAHSYAAWPVGVAPDTGLLAGRFSQLVGATFRLGVGIAAPFVLFAVIGNLVLGLVNRVMPSMPVFFVGTPAMLAAGLYAFVLTGGAMIAVALSGMSTWLSGR